MIERFIPLLLVLAACHTKSHETAGSMLQPVIDTLRVNGYSFIRVMKEERPYSLTSLDGKAIIVPGDHYVRAEFPDIDQDGYADLRVHVFSNTPNQCDNYLFDPALKTFLIIENSSLDIALIEGTKYYHSSTRAGCSGMNRESYLSNLSNRKEEKIGLMMVSNCDDGRDGIEVYRVRNEKHELVEHLPIAGYRNNEGNGYFIKYWSENYKAFE